MGRRAVGDLPGRLVDGDAGPGWLAVALAGPLAVGLLGVGAHRASGGGVQAPSRLPLLAVALVAALPFGPLGEELGWRGHALPRLLADRGALTAAVVLGLVWGGATARPTASRRWPWPPSRWRR